MVGYLFFALALVAVDRVLKVFLSALLTGGGAVMLIPGIIQLRYVENTGAAFGLFAGNTAVLAVGTGFLLLALLYLLVSQKIPSRFGNIALTLIVAGGLGNLYDRIANGFVVDYFEFTFFDYAVFNFADVLINIGAVMIAVYLLFFDRVLFPREREALPDAGEADHDA